MTVVVTTTEGLKQISGVVSIDTNVHESGAIISVILRDKTGADIAFFAGSSFVCWQQS